jgi:hypothetical protein
MTSKTISAWVLGVGMMVLTMACAREMPAGPSAVSAEVPAPQAANTTSGELTITLLTDNTASPSSVTVQPGDTILVRNNSGRYVLLRSPNCSEFSTMGLQNGAARHTWPFDPGTRTCDFYAYASYSQKTFVGEVHVR